MLRFSSTSRNDSFEDEGQQMGIVRKDPQQLHLLKQSLAELLNPGHPLYRLSGQMHWREIEEKFVPLYAWKGRRPKPIRLMVSLLMLKSIYGLSDESVVRIWIENPYFQFLSGVTVFQWKRPCHPTDLVYFRKRIGEEGVAQVMAWAAASSGPDFRPRPNRTRRSRRNSVSAGRSAGEGGG